MKQSPRKRAFLSLVFSAFLQKQSGINFCARDFAGKIRIFLLSAHRQQFPDREVRERPLAPGWRVKAVCVERCPHSARTIRKCSLFCPAYKQKFMPGSF